jgi:hypothetical protein
MSGFGGCAGGASGWGGCWPAATIAAAAIINVAKIIRFTM